MNILGLGRAVEGARGLLGAAGKRPDDRGAKVLRVRDGGSWNVLEPALEARAVSADI